MIDTTISKLEGNNYLKCLYRIIAISITILSIIFIIYSIKLGIFNDKNIMVDYIKELGLIAPIIFMLLQITQVIIPIIPGSISSIVGVLAFGSVLGFIYNYIGLIIGSIISYYLAKRYGISLIRKIFKEDTINKYLNKNKFTKFFLIAIILPYFPDDLLCYIAGISNMKFKNFIIIILLGRPISLIFTSYFITIL